jgi:HAE1 family hydrophobic/amphiphilic exporter-1
MNESLPEGVSIRVTSDDATFVGGALEKVLMTLVEATLIVVAVIFIFLRSWRATIIPAVTVPIALIGTLAMIYLAGFSLNILTLLAIVLATGLVVDDAIVVLENIERMRARGMGPRAAAVLGSRQVFFAVVATTATLAAVFIPISFFPGTAGRLFAEFGFVMAFAVTLSAIVALTLCPMLASRFLQPHDPHAAPSRNPLTRAVEALGSGAERLYHRLLDMALGAPAVVMVLSLLFAGVAGFAYTLLPEQLTPTEDRGIIPISVRAPQGTDVEYLEAQMRQVEAIAAPLVDVRRGGEHLCDRRYVRPECRLHHADARPLGEARPLPAGDCRRVAPETAGDPRGRGEFAPGQQPRHPRRRAGPWLRHHRHRIRGAGLYGRGDAGGSGRAACL